MALFAVVLYTSLTFSAHQRIVTKNRQIVYFLPSIRFVVLLLALTRNKLDSEDTKRLLGY